MSPVLRPPTVASVVVPESRPSVVDRGLRGRQVAAARALLGWSQHQLALRAGVSYPTISRIECGRRSYVASLVYGALTRAGVKFTERGVELVGRDP